MDKSNFFANYLSGENVNFAHWRLSPLFWFCLNKWNFFKGVTIMQSFLYILISAYYYINNISSFTEFTKGSSFVALIPHLRSITSFSEGWGILLTSASKWCNSLKCNQFIDYKISACEQITIYYDKRVEIVSCVNIAGMQPLWIWSSCLCN